MKINKPFALNETGKRQNQEDSIYPPKGKANTQTPYFMVCDGMGGHENGEVASGTVCKSFATYLHAIPVEDFNLSVFEAALTFAYDELDKIDRSSGHESKMGTTLAFLHLSGEQAFLAHIGDSRIYQLRSQEGKMRIIYKTEDHSLINELLKAEIITPEEAENHPKRNVITKAIQPRLEKRNKATIHQTTDVRAGDYFFLCSDGVLESINEDKLTEILSSPASDEEKMQTIRQLCETNSKDNYSAYLVPVGGEIASTKPTAGATARKLPYILLAISAIIAAGVYILCKYKF